MRASHFAFFMNLPTLLCLGLVLTYPIGYAAYLSVHRVGLGQLRRGEFPFNGWENYGRVLEDPLFWVALKNTLVFTFITVSSEIVLAVLIYAVTVPYVWRTLPFAIILVHAALQGIPRELYEQSAIDGANAWHRFWHITLPMLRQIIAIILILRTAFAFAVFEEILAITQGGPGDATWVAAWYSYKITFAPPNNFGMGSASAYILALMIGIIALVYMRFVYRRVTL